MEACCAARVADSTFSSRADTYTAGRSRAEDRGHRVRQDHTRRPCSRGGVAHDDVTPPAEAAARLIVVQVVLALRPTAPRETLPTADQERGGG